MRGKARNPSGGASPEEVGEETRTRERRTICLSWGWEPRQRTCVGLRAIVGRYQETHWDSVVTVMWHVLNLHIECAVVRYLGEDHPGHEARRDSVIMVGVGTVSETESSSELPSRSWTIPSCRWRRNSWRFFLVFRGRCSTECLLL